MKRCPECGREYDNTMMFCLDDGAELLYGPAKAEPPASAGGLLSSDEPATAILSGLGVPPSGGSASEPGAVATGFRGDEGHTKPLINTTDQTAILHTGAEAEPRESLDGPAEKQSFSANRAAKPLAALIVVILLLVGGFFAYKYLSPAKQINSIAVMPFVNESGNADIEYLSDGMTETLISSLSNIPNLSVKARSTVFYYKGKEISPKKIGEELKVQAVLLGRVSQRGDDLKLSLELVNTETQDVIWSEQYNRKQSDLVSLQSEIAKTVSDKLRLKLTASEQERVSKTNTTSSEAQQLYLKGRFHWNKRTTEDFQKAREYFQQAIAIDPNYALAHTGLADTLTQMPYYGNFRPSEYMTLAKAAEVRSMTDAFDENPGFVEWNADGMYFSGSQKTAAHLFRLDPTSGKITRATSPDNLIASGFSFSADGKQMAFTSASATSLNEVYVASTGNFAPKKLTSITEQVKDFTLATREVISWKSKDGAEIEGVLIKPANFDPSKKYALLCIIHGGPTGIDRPTLLDARYYPADIWAAKGALVLKVNYRGSAGYGEKFRQLNVRNLGVGDAWDVISGVDYLIGKGWVDPQKTGSMGWSQGGYISAFLTTSSDKFKAISVGAGISNWATYYYNTDITPFTIQYLGDDPANDPDVYAKTSPMTFIKQAKTPTLIQHGEFDRRVPIPNAYELRQGLEDRGVPVEMVVYKGFGHGITKPKSMRAVMMHNLTWFNHYIFGEPLPDFSKPEIPKKADDTKAGEKP